MLLDNVAVRPECQGKGIGRCLLDLAEATAKGRGYVALDLYTHGRMTENMEMYKRLGYVETERKTEQGYNRVYMRKPLS
jgi:ribosomal protein S18 acetylase RimI-like enzyme